MFGSSSKSEYDRGLEDAQNHTSRTSDTWVRATFGPMIWLGIPIGLTYLYLKRTSPKMPGGTSSSNPFSDMMEMMNPLQKRQFKVNIKGTKFSSVVGIPEAKEEIKQYVDFLINPNKFTRLGARLPKGCLLTGEPGTGKTLLAKAVAGEAEVPFFSCSGADFIEIVGGSGPKRVRELFEEARKDAPCIVFIDELDAIGSRGGNNKTSVSSEENRTINQLLSELDGLSKSNDAIVVLAATNYQDNIDKALLREGRFDRKIPIDMPDLTARREVFEHYLANVCTGDKSGRLKTGDGNVIEAVDGVDNQKIATELADLTPGLSPAAIASIVNEAALQAGIKDKKIVECVDLYEAVDNNILGKKMRNRMGVDALRRVAIHEAGKAFCSWVLPQQKDVLKISINARGNSVGYTQQAGGEFHEYQTNVTMYSDMVVLLGGRVAEEVVFGSVTTGAVNDLQKCTEMVMRTILAFGMSGNAGMLSYNPQTTNAGRSFVNYSETTQKAAEREASKLVEVAYGTAKALVGANKDRINKMAEELMEKKELLHSDIKNVWGERPTTPSVMDLVSEIEKVTNRPGVKVPSPTPMPIMSNAAVGKSG